MASAANEKAGFERVTTHLDELGVEYEVVEHPRRLTAAEEADAAGFPATNAAKVVLMRDQGGYRLAVLPASERLDVHKLRDLLDAGKDLRLATEEEMGSDFPGFELGALPPLGEMLPAAEIIDRRLLSHDRILCNGGDHEHSLLLDPRDILRVSSAREADICAD